eukprot:2259183-Rhodomonas_salina.1
MLRPLQNLSHGWSYEIKNFQVEIASYPGRQSRRDCAEFHALVATVALVQYYDHDPTRPPHPATFLKFSVFILQFWHPFRHPLANRDFVKLFSHWHPFHVSTFGVEIIAFASFVRKAGSFCRSIFRGVPGYPGTP